MTQRAISIIALSLIVQTAVGCGPAGRAERQLTWLRQHAVKVRSLDPSDEDFADLEPLGEAIGDARVVLLGEASHGEGATSLAKGRLLRFLHQRKGFDVLAWEAGFYDCAKAGRALAAGQAERDMIARGVPAWTRVEQCRPVMDYVRATQRSARPIALVGMSWYTFGDSALFDDAIAFFEAADAALPTPKQRRALARLQQFLGDLGSHRRPKTEVKPPELVHLEAMIDMLKRDPAGKFRRAHDPREIGFMRLALENLESFVQFWHKPLTRGGADDNPLGVIEGRNVVFFAREYFPQRKIIVWAHNGHIARGTSRIDELESKFKFSEVIATGERIHDALGDAVYSIMFTSHGGRSNGWWNEPRDLPPPPRGSLEDLLHRASLKRAFVDLRHLPPDHWLRDRLVAQPVSYAPMRADWAQIYDALFFVDTMTPSTSMSVDP